jgi:type VI secretion system secreted protein VgrG
MPMKQASRRLAVQTPLGDDVLVLAAFAGREEISRLFSYQLELISDNNAVSAQQIVGKNVTFSVAMADGSPRHFNGFVSRFAAGDEDLGHRRNYRAEVVPWLWFLTRTSDCRIFQSKSAPDIIKQIFQDLGFSDFKLQLSGKHPQRDYCVQYRETDFNFVSRLMEEEGIFYFFKHEQGKHTLVLADQKSAYVDCTENQVDYPRDPGSRAIEDHITHWEHRYEFRTGKWAQTDYNFETPSTRLMTNESTTVSLPDAKKYEFYDFPGTYAKKDDGSGLTKLRMEEEEVEYDVVQAASNCRSFTPGGKFKIRHHISKSEEGKGYVISAIQHAAREHFETGEAVGFDYQNSFACIPDSVVFRPPRATPRPMIHGVQPAVVTGPGGEEIYPDKYGRVKVQFFWDREGKHDDKSSCWIRVSQDYAGKQWGNVTIPRIGQEVLVSFLEGDPDRPIITGRVYNAEQMPPYPLPSKKMVSGLKSNSTPGGGGYNEYIFDDTKGNELIREHGQFDKDSTIEHDLREHVLRDRHRDVTRDETTVIGNNQTNTIHANRTETVDKDETITIHGNRTETVDKNETIAIHGGRTENVDKDENITIGGGRTENVSKDESITIGGGRTENVGKDESITIGGGRTENVSKDESITIGGGRTENVSKDESVTVGGGRTLSVSKDDGNTIGGAQTVSVGKTLTVTAADSITLTTGSASIVMKKDGTITINGKDITIEGSGQITGKASKDMVLKGQKILQN